MMWRTFAAASVVAIVAAAAPALAQDASVSVKDQKVTGNKVTVDKVTIPVDGWVVIHPSDASGHFIEKDIGHAPVKAGASSDISVTLTEDVKDGAKLHAMLHEDTGAKGQYEFGKVANADAPVMKGGKPVIDGFTAK